MAIAMESRRLSRNISRDAALRHVNDVPSDLTWNRNYQTERKRRDFGASDYVLSNEERGRLGETQQLQLHGRSRSFTNLSPRFKQVVNMRRQVKAEQYNMPYDQMSKVVYDYLYKMQNDEVQESNVIHDALHTQQSTNQW